MEMKGWRRDRRSEEKREEEEEEEVWFLRVAVLFISCSRFV